MSWAAAIFVVGWVGIIVHALWSADRAYRENASRLLEAIRSMPKRNNGA